MSVTFIPRLSNYFMIALMPLETVSAGYKAEAEHEAGHKAEEEFHQHKGRKILL